ncbi:UpxY family transcription antiterminator [Bacteroides stercorirosoris]|uniref:UpxY family transcription antiterminator n=1 Tax=Bacteroides stercorirosoris TaxID=871324 RepID=UPI0023F55A86|nr:UpxY family transcription antiterminator [Bacteroides stercorirosoris]
METEKDTEKETEKESEIWYAMRATYRREPDAMRLLEKENLGCFVPMQYKISLKKGRKVRALVPVVHNLLFVHARPSDVKRVKSRVSYLQYITDTRSGQKIIIPDSEMQRFIAVAGTYNDHLLYFQPDELNLSKGTKVRVIGGDFAGQVGIFLKVKGARDRRVVVEIQGVIAVAMATIHPDLIEVIK